MNNRQKKRIKDAARLVNSVTEMLDDMEDMSKQYDADLKSFISKIDKKDKKSSQSTHNPTSSESFNLMTLEDFEKKPEDTDGSESDEPSSAPSGRRAPPKKKGRPPQSAIKGLYRQVMRKCHPDRSSHEKLTPKQSMQYTWAVDEVTKAYQKNDVKMMIFIAAMVEEYSKVLSAKDCLKNLNELYGEKSEQLNSIQTSVAWLWGINWDTLEIRCQIIQAVANSYGIIVPPKVDLLEMLVKHETESL